MAALVVSAAGAWAGSAFGAAIGSAGVLGVSWAGIGWTAGGLLASSFQTQKVQGPRLNDLAVTGSAYGSPVPYVFGSPRISGQWIWSSQKREISTTTSRRAKGGPKIQSTSFTYEADMFLMLTSNEMDGVRRIWINGELQWTAADDADFGSINASGALARRVTVYTGADNQLPDPTYEAAVGAGAPAYIGHLTIFFEALQLGTSGQIPNITVEVVQRSSDTVLHEEVGLTPRNYWYGAFGTPYYEASGMTLMLGRWDSGYGSTDVDVVRFTPDGTSEILGTYQAFTSRTTVSGVTDEPVLVNYVQGGAFTGYALWADGTRTSLSNNPFRFAKLGDDMVIANGSGVLSRRDVSYRAGIGETPAVAPEMASATLPSAVNSLVILDDVVYALQAGSTARNIYVLELDDLSLVDTITSPSVTANATLLVDDLGRLNLMSQTSLYRYEDGAWTELRAVTVGYGAVGNASDLGSANAGALIDGVLYVVPYFLNGVGDQPARYRASWQAIGTDPIPLDEVVSELFERAGIDAADFDTSALAPYGVRGYAITPTTTRAVMDVLAQAYHFECSPGEKLVMVPLGGSVVATIPYEDLGTAPYGNLVDDPLPLVMRNDLETPGFVTVKYMNAANDGQPGAERSFRISTDSEAEMFVEVSILFMPSEAKKMADFLANLLEASLLSVQEVALQMKNTALQPCDPVLLTDRDGSTYRVRLQQRDDADGIIKFTAVFDNPQSISSDGVTDEDYESTTQIRVPSTTAWVYGDWPLFRDVDDNVGFYWAADGTGEYWPGAVLMESPDDVSYGQVSAIEERGVVGTAVTALGTWTGGNLVDTGNSVRVNVGQGTLASITYDEQLSSEKNVFMIGDECVIARTVTYVSAGIYDLKDLLRGRQGTEWAVGTHSIGEPVALIQMAGIRRVAQDLSKLNVDYYYRAVTMGRLLESATPRIESNTGISSKPWAPSNLTPTRSGTNLTPQWVRRTRLSENWLMDTVPLGEEEQLWRVRRYTSSAYTTVAEEQEVATVGGATFTSAPNPSYIGVSQWSARVGWGYELRGAI